MPMMTWSARGEANGDGEKGSATVLRAGQVVSHCARPTRAFSGRALREHRRPLKLRLDSYRLSKESIQIVLYCAHRGTIRHLIDPSKLAYLSSPGRAPMLVYVRQSNEALLRARVPGAQDQRGCPSHPSHPSQQTTRGTVPLSGM